MENTRPIIVVKKNAGHGGHHGGAWKVAYADFVTAMMALFIVLWIVGQNKAVKEAVAGYFKDPAGYSKGAHGVLKSGVGPGGALMPSPAPEKSPPVDPASKGDGERAALEATAATLRQKLLHEAQFTKLQDKIQIEVTDEGLRVHLVEAGDGVFFDVGSAAMKPAARQVVAIIAREVGRLPNEVVVEGHTDSRPYGGTPNYTNWELSADRANSARRVLEGNGLRPGQLE